MKTLLFLAIVLCVVAERTAAKRGFILTAPRTLHCGTRERLFLQIFDVDAFGVAIVTLYSSDKSNVLAEMKVAIKSDGSPRLYLIVPTTHFDRGYLSINGSFGTEDKYTIHGETEVYLKNEDPLIIFIQTEKQVYIPGQTVRFRVLPLNQEMKPLRRSWIGEVKVEDPSGATAVHWSNVSFALGLVQLEIPLSEAAAVGQWVITVMVRNRDHSQMFTVDEFRPNRFEVLVSPPPYVLANAESVPYTICAKYPYGRSVNGRLNISASINTSDWIQGSSPQLNHEVFIKGCHQYVLNVSQIEDDRVLDLQRPIVLTAEVIESRTGLKNTGWAKVIRTEYPLKFKFLETRNVRQYFKPGLPYFGKIQVMTPDGASAPHQSVEFRVGVSDSVSHFFSLDAMEDARRVTFMSDQNGIVHFTLPAQTSDIVTVYILATAPDIPEEDDTEGKYKLHKPYRTLILQPWYSLSDSFLEIVPGNQALECDRTHDIKVLYTAQRDTPYNFHYQVKARGKIVFVGSHKTTFDPADDVSGRRDKTHLVPMRAEELFPYLSEGTTARRSLPRVGETSLRLDVTHVMSPSVLLLVFYIREDGEIVSDTKELKIMNCLRHKVSLKFGDENQFVGATTSVKVAAHPHSICGVEAKNKRAYQEESGNQLKKDRILEILKGQEPSNEDQLICRRAEWEDSNDVTYSDRGILPRHRLVYRDSMTAFQDGGFATITDFTLVTRPCSAITYMAASEFGNGEYPFTFDPHGYIVSNPVAPFSPLPLVTTSAIKSQSYFPETWLFESYTLGGSGEVTLQRTLPNTVTTWLGTAVCVHSDAGLGISDVSTITADQALYLSASLPDSVFQGEPVPIDITAGVYLPSCLPVLLSLDTAETYTLLSDSPSAKLCVCGGETQTHRFTIHPKILGHVSFRVTGISYRDDTCDKQGLSIGSVQVVAAGSLFVQGEVFSNEEVFSTFFCPQDYPNRMFRTMVSLPLPQHTLEGSAQANFSVTGEPMGLAIEGLENILRRPTGSGEENMVTFMPTIFVMDYLKSAGRLNWDVAITALGYIKTGYQRQIMFRNEDGSYGIKSDGDEGSTWLSSFVLKALSHARRFIIVNETDFADTASWVIAQQQPDGCFHEGGIVLRSSMKGGLQTVEDSRAALSAYVLIALLEYAYYNTTLVNTVITCLEREPNPSPYTLALFAYATSLAAHRSSSDFLERLKNLATQKGDLTYWETNDGPNSKETDIETAAYVLLSLMQRGGRENVAQALPIVRWLSQQSSTKGGFKSTQDSVVALQALARFASYVNRGGLVLEVQGEDISKVFILNNRNRYETQTFELETLPYDLEVNATGNGCAVIQTNMRYSVQYPGNDGLLELVVSTHRGVFGDCRKADVYACTRFVKEGRRSNRTVMEVQMAPGFRSDSESLQRLKKTHPGVTVHVTYEGDTVFFYFAELTNQKQCVNFVVEQTSDETDLQPGEIHVYDFEKKGHGIYTQYTIGQDCSWTRRSRAFTANERRSRLRL